MSDQTLTKKTDDRCIKTTTNTSENKRAISSYFLKANQLFQKHIEDLEGLMQRDIFPYPISRSLEGEGSYLKFLPSFRNNKQESLSFIEVIDDLISQRKKDSMTFNKSYDPVVIFDLGPGNFKALLEARAKWQSDVVLVGVGPDILMDFNKYNQGKKINSTRAAVMDADIHVIVESLVNIESITKELIPDVIISSHALQYTCTPLWETFKKIYNVLKPEGYIFAAFGAPHISTGYSVFAQTADHFAHAGVIQSMNREYKNSLIALNDLLGRRGYQFNIDAEEGTLACRKINAQGNFSLPEDIFTIIKPTPADLNLEGTSNRRVDHWCNSIAEVYSICISAYPVMFVPKN